MNWFYETSLWITLPLFVGGFVLGSCLIVVGLRPVVRRMVASPAEWDRALAHVSGTFGVFFGILLVLVAVSVYENFAEARHAALEEAAQVAALYRDTTAMPEEDGEPVRDSIAEYLHTVVDEDFPSRSAAFFLRRAPCWWTRSSEMLHDYEPETIPAQAEYIQLLATFDDFVEARRERIDAITLELPPLFWLVIWVGAAVNAILIAFIYVKSMRLHLMIAGLLALFVGLVMFVTADMDHPYQGSISVGPGAFERVLEQTVERLDAE